MFRVTCSDDGLTVERILGGMAKILPEFWLSISVLLSHKHSDTASDDYNF